VLISAHPLACAAALDSRPQVCNRSLCGFGFARWRNLTQRSTQFVLGLLKIILCLHAHSEGG